MTHRSGSQGLHNPGGLLTDFGLGKVFGLRTPKGTGSSPTRVPTLVLDTQDSLLRHESGTPPSSLVVTLRTDPSVGGTLRPSFGSEVSRCKD